METKMKSTAKNIDSIKVLSTLNYDFIKSINGNRGVNPKNVELIKKSMEKEHLIVPAILNEKFEIIDGQHRFQACKQLKLPFYYLIVEGYTLKHVQQINANMHNWSLADYLESFIDRFIQDEDEFEEYAKIKELIDTTEVGLSGVIAASNFYVKSSILIEQFKHGNFEFLDFNMTKKLLEEVSIFKEKSPKKWNSKQMIIAFSKLYFNSEYNRDKMIKNIQKIDKDIINDVGNQAAMLDVLLDIHNMGIRKAVKLHAIDLERAWDDMLEEKKI